MIKNRIVVVAALLTVFVLGSLARNTLADPDGPLRPNVALEPPWLPTEAFVGVQPNKGIEPPWLPTDDAPGTTATPDRKAAAIEAAQAAFASEFEVPVEWIRVVSVWPTEWPSTALGCPEPGQTYLQVVTPGFVVELAALDELTATYHTSDGTIGPLQVVRCDDQ